MNHATALFNVAALRDEIEEQMTGLAATAIKEVTRLTEQRDALRAALIEVLDVDGYSFGVRAKAVQQARTAIALAAVTQ